VPDFGTLLVLAGSALFTFLAVYLASMNLYLTSVSLFGLRKRKEPPFPEPAKRFAVLVPAHDEELVIGQTVRSLLGVDYPRELFEVFVVADNCTDATADHARAAGATVLERFDDELRGKPHAVAWALERILADRAFDAVVQIDADNVVSANLLRAFNSRLLRGETVIQAYLDAKNPDDTWITWMYAMLYWVMSRFVQLAHYQAGLPCQLGGTGYCIDAEVLRRYGWDVTSLTDDLEYTMRMVLNGIHPTWIHDAVVYDEKPLTMKASLRQRLRWAQGHWDVASRYTWPLVKTAVARRSLGAFDAVLYCLAPTRTMLWGLTLVFAWVPFLFPQVVVLVPNPGVWLGFGALAFYTLYPLLFFALERVPARFYARFGVLFIFTLTWIWPTVRGLVRRRLKHWDKTEHTRSMSTEEAERLRGTT
jgi:cellulose synthase/poly-beta-1,6-N-acetylglucosamine synthase-like glycosyltransferase